MDTVTLQIDGHTLTVPAGTTIWDAAASIGITIPALCHDPRMAPVGVCRLCAVDIGARTLVAACVRACEDDMEVHTSTEQVVDDRRTLLELLLADYPEDSRREAATGDDELLALARAHGIEVIPYADGAIGQPRGEDHSSAVIAVDHQACILCDRCIRGCNALQHNDVLTRTGKGYTTRIAFDLDTPMGESTCVACGECAAVCPTGALTNRALAGLQLMTEEQS